MGRSLLDQIRPTADVLKALDKLKTGTVGDMGTIATSVRLNMRLIARSMADGSAEARQALSAELPGRCRRDPPVNGCR